jgi:hypothetical protein
VARRFGVTCLNLLLVYKEAGAEAAARAAGVLTPNR